MKNFLFDKHASELELVSFKFPAYKGTIKGKTSLENGNLVKINYKIKEVKSIFILYNPDKDIYETETETLCERMVSEE